MRIIKKITVAEEAGTVVPPRCRKKFGYAKSFQRRCPDGDGGVRRQTRLAGVTYNTVTALRTAQ